MSAPQYEIINMTVADLERIDLPRFQRRLVWNKGKKESFITTLHEGLPFGAVLVYPKTKDTEAPLLILDGQQRLSTIRSFMNNPLTYWKTLEEDEYDKQLKLINEKLPGDLQLDIKSFDELFQKDDDALDDWLDDIEDKSSRKQVRGIIKQTRSLMKDYVDLSSLKIPAIEFRGSEEKIADVFTNLNQGGVPLSKYEIFNAAWIHTEIKLDSADISPLQDKVLSYVKQHYSDMSKNTEFELDDFSEDELSQERVITLSELGIALGMFIREHLNALAPQTDNAIAELGFGVLGIATGIDNRRLGTLNGSVDEINRNLQGTLERIDRICTNLQDIFSKLLKRFKSSKNDEYALGISTTFKTLSYFAALWDLDPDSKDYRMSLKNIKAYYVYDALTKVWASKGDQRLLDYYPGNHVRNYLNPIGKVEFEDAFDRWLADTTPGINFSKEITALVTIHANLTYLATTVSYGESYELEHIISKKLINAHDTGSSKKLYGNSVGNCMYLPRFDNNKKKDKTLYEANDGRRYDKLIQESLYFSEDTLIEAIEAIKRDDFDAANEIIKNRAKRVAHSTVEALLA